MGLGPDRLPVIYPVSWWLEIAGALDGSGDGALADAIRGEMDGRSLGNGAAFALSDDERERVARAAAGAPAGSRLRSGAPGRARGRANPSAD